MILHTEKPVDRKMLHTSQTCIRAHCLTHFRIYYNNESPIAIATKKQGSCFSRIRDNT